MFLYNTVTLLNRIRCSANASTLQNSYQRTYKPFLRHIPLIGATKVVNKDGEL